MMVDSGAEKDTVLDSETLAVLATSIRDRELPEERESSLKSRIQARIRATAPAGTETVRAGEGRWQALAPGVDIKILHFDLREKMQTSLWRLAPGAVLAEHPHRCDEECLVLEGEIHAGEYYVRAGDYHLAKAGHAHPRLETSEGALLLIRGEMHEALA